MKIHKRNKKTRNARRNKKKALSANATGAPDKVIVRLDEVAGHINNVEDPFNFLPNEMLQIIFSRVELQHLIKVRAVCKRWQSVIESVCKNTKSLALACLEVNQLTFLSEMFFRKLNFGKNEILILKPSGYCYRISLSNDFCAFLVKLFPRIEKFAIDPDLGYTSSTTQNCCSLLKQWSASLVALSLPCGYDQSHYNDLWESINALTKLKWLNIKESYIPVKEMCLLVPTFVRLEHFCPLYCLQEQRLEMVKHLGSNCSSLWLGLNSISLEEITELLDRNSQLITNLEHLQFRPYNFEVVSFIFEKLTLLRSLFIERIPPSEFLTIDFIRNVNRLPHLANLTIWLLHIDLDLLEPQANQLIPLLNIQTLSIGRLTSKGISHQSITKDFDGGRLCRLLATIFPNLESLFLNSASVSLSKSSIEPHLGHFKRIRSFVVEYDKY